MNKFIVDKGLPRGSVQMKSYAIYRMLWYFSTFDGFFLFFPSKNYSRQIYVGEEYPLWESFHCPEWNIVVSGKNIFASVWVWKLPSEEITREQCDSLYSKKYKEFKRISFLVLIKCPILRMQYTKNWLFFWIKTKNMKKPKILSEWIKKFSNEYSCGIFFFFNIEKAKKYEKIFSQSVIRVAWLWKKNRANWFTHGHWQRCKKRT